jgi:hypothetical protein
LYFEIELRGAAFDEALFGLDPDVAALGVLESLDDVRSVDGIALGDILVVDTLAGLTVDLVELHLAGGVGGGKDLHSNCHQGYLNRT